jgi:SAM-dependent methyltransferase
VNSRFRRGFARTLLGRQVFHFEAAIERAVAAFAAGLRTGARVLDAGAGEGQYAHYFDGCRYVGIDMAVGDPAWDYSRLQAIGDLVALPFAGGSFDAAINIVTLEHVPEPGRVLQEIARALSAGGTLLLVVPHQWEVHQEPHDYFRFTRHGIRRLLEEAGFTQINIEPAGGLFRLLSRRLLNALQLFPALVFPVATVFLAPPALILPLFDFLDRDRSFTLGYICTASKSS